MGPIKGIVLPTEEEIALVRKSVGVSEDDIRQTLAIVRNWIDTQPHLPKNMDDERLERMYISCKGRVEKLKQMVDAYYTLKLKIPYFLTNRDALGDDIQSVSNGLKLGIMPKLTSDYNRVSILTGINPDHRIVELESAGKLALMFAQLFVRFDYSIGCIIVIDLKNVTPSHIMKVTVRVVRGLELVARTAFSKKVKALHFINAPKAINMLLSIVKPALPAKIAGRIVVHDPDSETLFDYIPRDVLPVEVGGTDGSIEDVMRDQLELTIQYRDWFLEEDKYVADEEKRPEENSYEYNLFGVDGSFKKLQVD